ncbi:hypothetical protein HPP92_003820 [Vanilla planifolia]|uniref:DUF7870 domain-containing protein n=1 Tax=Vanilla planifolia TaxID=51239 RepID=A0A835RZ55_VANPL|nr:hypothetical protein HPP92_004264 [Vanilla planifolia]KAG0503748.1 hypothetical protein HPP92_003820 [Vanilla planifolia]
MSKKGELRALEDLLLEPPVEKNDIRRPRYLPKLTGDSLDKYPRRIFVDFGSRGRIGAENWFLRNYPKSRKKFEMARVDLVGMPVLAGGGVGGVADWLTMNAREEDFVVVKAEEEAVVDLVNGKAIGLVDELFLECSSQWGSEKNVEDETRRNTPYWACLALLGKLREDGIAVHQWWDLNKQWK